VVRGRAAVLSFKFVIVGPSLLYWRPLLGRSDRRIEGWRRICGTSHGLEHGNEGRTPNGLIPREAGVQLSADRRRDASVDAKRSTIGG